MNARPRTLATRSEDLLARHARLHLFLLLALASAVFLGGMLLPAPAKAQTPPVCAATGHETVAADRPGYYPGATAQITGTGYARQCAVTLDVYLPDGSMDSADYTTDGNGNFSASYVLGEVPGQYIFNVMEVGDQVASGDFTIGSAPTPQCDQTQQETIEADFLHYLPGDAVNVTGSGFAPSCEVLMAINVPDGNSGGARVTTDSSGNLTYSYQLDPVTGDYSIQALTTDGAISMATTSFSSGVHVVTDRDDYTPGEHVTFIGRGFQPGEAIKLVVRQVYPGLRADRALACVADASGAFVNGDFAVDAQDLRTKLSVTATGQSSGSSAVGYFKDGTVNVVQKAVNQTTATAVSSLTANYGAFPKQGNLLVAVAGSFASNNTSVTSATGGWTSAISESGTPTQAIWWKIAGASEPKAVTASFKDTVTNAALSTTATITIYEISGVLASSPVDGTASNTGTSTTADSGTVATTLANDLLIAGLTANGNDKLTLTYSIPSITHGFTVEAPTPTVQGGGTGTQRVASQSADRNDSSANNTTSMTVGAVVIAASWGTGSGGTATVNIGSHHLTAGMSITIAGVVPSAYNGTYNITSVTGSTVSYLLPLATNPGNCASPCGGIATVPSLNLPWRGQIVAFKTKTDTSTAISVSPPSASAFGTNLTINATVTPASVSGSVTFLDGGSGIAGCTNVAVLSGSATCSTAALTAGTHSLTAMYNGDGVFNASTSAASSYEVVAANCFRSVASGNWNQPSSWETAATCAGPFYAAATVPTSTAVGIEIRSGFPITVTAAATAAALTVDPSAQLTINSGQTLALGNGAGDDLSVFGTVNVNGTLGFGQGTSVHVQGVGTLNVPVGGLVSMSPGSCSGASFTQDAGSGSMTVGGTVTAFRGTYTLNGNVTVTGALTTSDCGNYTIGGHTTVFSAGGIAIAGGSAPTVSVVSGGTLTLKPTATVTKAGGSNGSFSVLSGATLEIGSPAGIDSTGATGNVRIPGVSYNTGANYTYNGTAAQSTGNALPSLVNSLTIANSGPATVTLAFSISVNDTLSVTSGTFDVGSLTLTTGTTLVGSGATLRMVGSGTFWVGPGGVSNAGTVVMNGGTSACGEADSLSIASTGTQRAWSGGGTFDIEDAAIQDQGGTASITALSSSDNGNNGANWKIFASCDATPPDTSITSNPSNPSNSSSASFGFASDDAGATFECQLDGGGFVACSSPASYSSLGDGSHTFDVRARDPANNVDPTPASFTWTIDATPPDTVIDTGPTGTVGTNSASFTFHASETSSFECDLDGGGFVACASPQSYPGPLADGSHTFQVRATDSAGNTDASPASQSWTVDTTAPDTTVDSGPVSPTNDQNPSFTFSSDDPGATFECQLDGGGFSVCTSPKSYSSIGDGSHTFEVRATDAVGNTDATPASFTWTIDTTAPDTILDSMPLDPTNQATANFTFHATDVDSSLECDLDGSGFSVCTSPASYPGLADGSHTFQVRAKDSAGNVDPTPASFTWTVDTSAPNTLIDSAPGDPTNSNTATFTFHASEGSTFQCSLDGAPFASCTSPATYIGLGEGGHTFDVEATDSAGNTDPTPGHFAWTVDMTAPDTTITSGPAGGSTTSSTSATFEFTGSDAVTPTASLVFECQLDAGGFAACTSPVTYSGLADGSHTFDVRAKDEAGNTDVTPDTRTWTISASTTYSFTGFFPPLDNPPTFNSVKAGAGVPVKFGLGGNQGLNIFAAGYPVSQRINCVSTAPIDVVEVTVTAGSSSLQYDAASGQYIYVWKTDKAWAGTCRQLTVRFNEGTTRTANFMFK